MIKLKAAGIEIGIDFTFFALIAIYITFDTTGFAVISLLTCIIHEAGHLTTMFIFRQKPESIVFRGGGIRIGESYNADGALKTIGFKERFIVLISGSAVNICLFLFLYFSLPKTNIYPIMFAILNLIIGLFNLLPIGCLDGKQLLELFLPERILNIVEALFLILVVIIVIIAVISGGVNFTIAAAMFYVLCVDFFGNMC
ncbi:MAG: hypothetical protein FWF94_07270 [Oscillospiraceae bacterium]|nr:hypothetical protein [Oscillospiraceae bacterium]